jgi:periplasmic copper chaperone A
MSVWRVIGGRFDAKSGKVRRECSTLRYIFSSAMEPRRTMRLSQFMKHITALFCAASLAFVTTAFAQSVEVKNPWVRPTVPGQKGTGGFATFTAKDGAQLVGVRSAVAGVSEVHEMKLDASGTMRMSAMKALDLPAGQAVELKPGGLHLMLMDLKTALPKDTTVPVGLDFVAKDGKRFSQTVSFAVSPRAPGAAASGHEGHSGHKH